MTDDIIDLTIIGGGPTGLFGAFYAGMAAIAANNAVDHIDPSARVNPGHSTNLKIFKAK